MGIVGFVWYLHQRQHQTAQRLGAPTDGSAMLTGNCDIRMIRGSSYFSEVRGIRSALRFFEASDAQSKRIGFRVIQELPQRAILAALSTASRITAHFWSGNITVTCIVSSDLFDQPGMPR